jgi:hypothetical protein
MAATEDVADLPGELRRLNHVDFDPKRVSTPRMEWHSPKKRR